MLVRNVKCLSLLITHSRPCADAIVIVLDIMIAVGASSMVLT
jgi:hypothetical protein